MKSRFLATWHQDWSGSSPREQLKHSIRRKVKWWGILEIQSLWDLAFGRSCRQDYPAAHEQSASALPTRNKFLHQRSHYKQTRNIFTLVWDPRGLPNGTFCTWEQHQNKVHILMQARPTRLWFCPPAKIPHTQGLDCDHLKLSASGLPISTTWIPDIRPRTQWNGF